MKTIIGIDPGYSSLGIAGVDVERGKDPTVIFSKTLRTSRNDGSRSERVTLLVNWIEEKIILVKPDLIVIEDFVHFRGRIISIEAWNVPRVIGSLYRLGKYAPIVELNPSEWTAEIIGRTLKNEEAQAETIRVYCALHLGVDKKDAAFRLMTAHEIDAICLAIVGSNHVRVTGKP